MPTYWQNKLIKASTILQWFFMLSTPQETAEVIDAAYQKYFAMADPNFNWHKPIQKFTPKFRCNYRHMIETMANILEEPYYKVHDIYLQSIADQRGCQIIIALRRYKNKNGAWPQSLDDIKNLTAAENLIDPLNNDSYVYRLTEENFTLYSKGKNNLDENGKSDRCSEKVTGADDLLIWPSRSSKTKEENKDVK